MSNEVSSSSSEIGMRPEDHFGRILLTLAKLFAIFGGIVLLVIVAVNFLSILGRFFFSSPLVGDFELVKTGCAVAISAFLPICQLMRGNVIVDFVTAGLSERTRQIMDGISGALFAMVAIFFTWRMFYGIQDMYKYSEETMLLQIPVWIPFIPVIASFLLLSLCCIYTSFTDFRQARH
ncbi:MAG: TRAP transporter small permease [Rhizobiaceae bacterium]